MHSSACMASRAFIGFKSLFGTVVRGPALHLETCVGASKEEWHGRLLAEFALSGPEQDQNRGEPEEGASDFDAPSTTVSGCNGARSGRQDGAGWGTSLSPTFPNDSASGAVQRNISNGRNRLFISRVQTGIESPRRQSDQKLRITRRWCEGGSRSPLVRLRADSSRGEPDVKHK